MEKEIFYGIVNSELEVVALSLDKKDLREPKEDEAVFSYDTKSRMTSISVKTGSKFQILKQHHKIIEAAVQSQKIPVPIVEITKKKV